MISSTLTKLSESKPRALAGGVCQRYKNEDISYLELAREIAKDPEEVKQLITEHFRTGYGK